MKKCKKILRAAMVLFAVGLFFVASVNADAAAKKKDKRTSLSKAKITLSKTKYTYNGKAKKPKVTVKIGKKKISKGSNYTVTYSKNKKAGTAKVTIKAKKKSKKVKGKKVKTFKIQKASRTLTAGRPEYTAIEGDGSFNITAKASKGTGTINYSCPTSNVVKVASNGTVTVVGRGTAVVNISIPETANYKAASTTTKVTISKKTITVDSVAGVKNFDYATQIARTKKNEGYTCSVNALTDFNWSIVTKYAIPGLAPTADDDLTNGYIQCNNLCPQGFCFAGDYLLTTAYCMDDVHNSCVFIYNKASGAYLKTIVLSSKSHVGGIAYDTQNSCVWICHAGSKKLQKITYASLKKYSEGTKGIVKVEEVVLKDIPAKPSSVTYNAKDGLLWVAEYVSAPDSKKGNDAYMYPYQYKDDKLLPATYTVVREETMERAYLGVETEDLDKNEPEEQEPGQEDANKREAETGAEGATGAAITGVVVSSVMESKTIQNPKVKILSFGTEEDDSDSEEKEELSLGKSDYTIKLGDIITQVNGTEIASKKELDAVLKKVKAKTAISISLIRYMDGKKDRAWQITGKITTGVYEEEVKVPARLLPNRVQGLAFTESGDKLILSRSTGRNTEKTNYMSQIEIYNWDTKAEELPKPNQVVVLPPMVEQIQIVGDSVYLLFESAATTYLEGTDGSGKSESAIDKLVTVKMSLV